MKKIKTEFIYPPIPDRSHDWMAYYEGEEESGIVGYGKSEEDAISDLESQAE